MNSASIIIPAYRRVEQTVETIRLLQASTGWNSLFHAEIIVADSTDDDSIKSAVNKFEGVTYTKPTSVGISKNKNAGAALAKHDVLIFCDSDIEVEPDTVLNTLQALINNPNVAGLTGQIKWRGGSASGTLDRPRTEDRMYDFGSVVYTEAIYSRFFATYKHVFESVGGYDDELFNMRGEGSDLSIRYWRAGFPLAYFEKIIAHHVHGVPDSIALRIKNPQYDIAKDLLLLALKYDLKETDTNFVATITKNFHPYGDEGYASFVFGFINHKKLIAKALQLLDKHPLETPRYAFKFLEVFSDEELLKTCIKTAQTRIFTQD